MVVLYCSWTVPEGIHHLWLYELLYKFVQEFLPRVDKTKLGSRGDTVRYLKHIDTIGIAWHTLSICDLLGGTSRDWDKYLSWREIKEEEAGRNMIRPPSDFSYIAKTCVVPQMRIVCPCFVKAVIFMYFTSDQRNFLEFGNVCPNQNFVYCDKPCGCKVAERNIMSCNVGIQFFCNASNLIRWLWTAFSDSRELSMYEAVSQHVVDDVKYIVCNPGNTVWECAFGLHVYSSIEFNARQCSAMWWHVLQCNFIWYQ